MNTRLHPLRKVVSRLVSHLKYRAVLECHSLILTDVWIKGEEVHNYVS